MTSLSLLRCTSLICSIKKGGHEQPKKSNINNTKLDATSKFASVKIDLSIQKNEGAAAATTSAPSTANSYINDHHIRRKFPAREQLGNPFHQARINEGEICSRHIVVIRSFEVGADGTASIETILNLLQETGVNHTRMAGLCVGGFGCTNGMTRNNLIWVIARTQVQVDRYPTWDEAIEIEIWLGASGRHGIRSDWLLRSQSTGHILARATSKWAMMNRQTRRLSKMPDEVRAELSPWFSHNQALEDQSSHERIVKLDKNAKYVFSGLKPRWSDLDMNQHVNNVKYARWMLEALPDNFSKNSRLFEITLEFKRECGILDVVQSLCEPHEGGILEDEVDEHSGSFSTYTHMLQTEGESKNEEIIRGRTRWRRKNQSLQGVDGISHT